MAAVTSAAIGIGASAYQVGSAISQKKKAQDAIDDYEPQELTNPYKAVRLATDAAEQQTATNISNVATGVDALQRTGARGVAAGVPRLAESSLLVQDKISADLTKQAQRRDILIAQGEDRITNLQEQREREMLAGLGQQLNVANQDIMTGVQGAVSSGLAMGSAIKSKTNDDDDDDDNGFGADEVAKSKSAWLSKKNPLFQAPKF